MAASEQHMTALAKGNAIRLRRSEIKRQIKAGTLDLPDLIRAVPSELETIRVAELLCTQKHWGPHRTREFLHDLHIGEHRKLGALTERQRGVLSEALAARRNGR